MSINPERIPTPMDDVKEIFSHFMDENPIEQVNYDLFSLINLIGLTIKNPDTTQLDREKYYSYMLLVQNIHRLINEIHAVTSSQKLSFPC